MDERLFRHTTVRDAVQAMHDELGPDAVVLDSALVAARGWRGWLGARDVQVRAMAPDPPGPPPGRPDGHERRPADTSSVGSALVARLTAAGVDPAFAEQVAASVPPRQQRGMSAAALRRALADHLAGMTAADDGFARIEVFVGPPGVGKTTTIAKIAAQERGRRRRSVALVAADAFRAGAVEQLRTYASIIGTPFRAVRSVDEMHQAIDAARHTLLVDTAGRSPADGDLRDVRQWLGTRRTVRTHLVIPGDSSVASARRIVQTFASAQPDRIVLSKVDEADAPSALMLWLRERGTPISYVAMGQRVPEDLATATPAVLSSALLGDLAPGQLGAA